MRILIAEDDVTSRMMLRTVLEIGGHEVLETQNGREALEALTGENPPRLAVLDWMMPELDGVSVCRAIRSIPTSDPPYIMMVTAKADTDERVEGLDAGANDYLVKPVDPIELNARLRVGARVLELQASLNDRIRQLEEARDQIRVLEGFIPICMYCKHIRNDTDAWERMEQYIESHTSARFSHGVCPECMARHHPDVVVKKR